MKKRNVGIMKMMIIYLITLLFILTGCSVQKTNTIHLIPEGYEGNLVVIYNVEGKPPLKTKDGYQVVQYNDKGIALTSTPDAYYGTVNDKYFYVNPFSKRKEISQQCVFSAPNGSTQYNGGREFPFSHLIVTNDKKQCSHNFEVNGPRNLNIKDVEEIIKQELINSKTVNLSSFQKQYSLSF
ncbi:DUF6843 domain-containing protein [Shimazuella alba]|uniref:DUF6843 domain-containing protein n=1 Tax=Shimazuella alba TaxID=2690964 RepID=A0A6I4VZ48_9BACL|nr:hypothetical protein [Shimazuella alba]MXQ53362.1 hypothetical protein [Shimazuella alba]